MSTPGISDGPSPYALKHDGKVLDEKYYDDIDDAWVALLKIQGQSVDWAIRHGGWSIVSVPPSDREYIIYRDRKYYDSRGMRYATKEKALEDIKFRDKQHQYTLVQVPDEKWIEDEQRYMRAQARYLFKNHGHGSDMSQLARVNCQACCLNGYEPRGGRDGFGDDWKVSRDGPCVANWQRTYVQAGHPIPRKWEAAFDKALTEDNPQWVRALSRDITTFGVTWKD